MKYIVLSLLVLVGGCAQLTRGQEQPVVAKNAKEGIYYTTCSGAVETWASCNNKAMNTCTKGYSVVDKFQDSNGTIRSLTFQCNK